MLPMIAKEFHIQYNIEKGIQEATITTAFDLDEDLKKKFSEIVSELSSGKTVDLGVKINTDIIGGFQLKVGDLQIDESISSKIRKLKLELN